MIGKFSNNLGEEVEYLTRILRGKDLPGLIMFIVMFAIDLGFVFESSDNGIIGIYLWLFSTMNTIILGFYFWSKWNYNENFLLYRLLLRIAIAALLIWIARVALFVP